MSRDREPYSEGDAVATVISPPPAQLITGEEFFELGDIGSCELIAGRIVPMSPPGGEHGELMFNLGGELRAFIRQQKLGRLVGGETGVYTARNPDQVRGVDLAIISYQRLPGPMPKAYLEVAPELVVEIVSPNDRFSQLRQKIDEYFAIGVEQVWVVDPADKSVLIYRAATSYQHLGPQDTLVGEGLLDGFSLAVAAIFDSAQAP
jgi:Uma2 family endonuclease